MKMRAEIRGEVLVIHLEEERLDAAIAIRFKERMREMTMAPPARVVLNLASVVFLDSSGLGALVAVMKSLPPPRQLELACLTPNVDKVLRMTRMDSIFPIHPTLDIAAKAG